MEIIEYKNLVNFLISYCNKPQGFAVFHGKNGVGKTYNALKIYNHHATLRLPSKNWQEACFMSQTDLNMLFFNQIKLGNDLFYLINEIVDSPLFILDDLGTRTPTEPFADFLYSLIDKRLCKNMPTIFTTNLTHSGIAQKFGEAIASRVCSGYICEFKGRDRRYDTPKTQNKDHSEN